MINVDSSSGLDRSDKNIAQCLTVTLVVYKP